jgi:TP901 family phage tail tape measure protein
MADIESNIKVNIDTSDALSQLKLLQQQISVFQQAMKNAGAQNAQAAAQMQQNLMTSINATGKFNASIQTIKTSAESFTQALEKNKLSTGEYFRYAGGASKTFGKLFKAEFDTIQQVAVDRVKTIQTQYIKLGRDASGAMKAISVRPLALDMDNLGTKTQIAAQKQQLFNQLMKQGSTQLLNFGKNTQWAGRQLMVGFTVPLVMMGSAAAKAYTEIEKASIAFKRVYGDINTTANETEKMVANVRALATEFTKYGVAVADTMDMAAKAAAMGKTGADLLAQVSQANKLSVLGQVDQQQALDTTISLTNAFGIATEDLAGKIDFLNAVENQTVTSIEDLTVAIPKAAPVIQQLGGDVEDLTFFLTAMREGGINASEGANALKSGLASMINPTGKATEFLQSFGINLKSIVETNKGDVKGTVVNFAKALDTLDPLNRARAIEQLFGKFQFSRISTLFKNVIDEGSQANRVAGLARETAQELSILSERELKKVSDSPLYKFQKSIEEMKAKLAPVGEAFLKAVTPVVELVGRILDGFNGLSDGAKQFASIATLAIAGIGPILLMTFGLIANGVANIMKMFVNLKSFFNKTGNKTSILGEQTSYMNSEQLRGAAIAASLDQAHAKLRQTFTSEAAAVDALTQAYKRAVTAQGAYSGIPGVPVGGAAVQRKKYANGVSMVPGPDGAGDIVPALLSPGEAVIPARYAKKYAPVIRGMVSGNLQEFNKGTVGAGKAGSVPKGYHKSQSEWLSLSPQEVRDVISSSKMNRAHLTSEMKSNPKVAEYIRKIFGPGVNDDILKSQEILGNFTADVPDWVNQKLRISDIGIPQKIFTQSWNALEGKLFANASVAQTSTGKKIPKTAAPIVLEIENAIGKAAAGRLKPGKVKSGEEQVVYDTSLDEATKQVLAQFSKKGGMYELVADAFARRAGMVGTMRTKYGGNEQAKVIGLVKSGQAEFSPSGGEIKFKNTSLSAGRWNPPSSKAKPVERARFNEARAQWIADGKNINDFPKELSIRGTSQSKGKLGTKENISYEVLGSLISKILNPNVFNIEKMANSAGYFYDKKAGFFKDPLKFAKGTPEITQSAVAAFGAHQPFTSAHESIARMGMDLAAKQGVPFRQFSTMQGKAKRSILPDELKAKLIQESIGITPDLTKNPFTLMETLSSQGVKNLTLLLGEDRMGASVFDVAAAKYGIKLNKVAIPRDPNGVSGTKTRLAAGNKDWKTFFSLVAPGATQSTKREVFKQLQSGMGVKKYANGVFSVPGPKGAGDVVPAMLSPGEAVIPADKAAQHRPMIRQMISGSLPGYNKGTAGVPGYFDGIPGVPKPPSVTETDSGSGGIKGVLSSLAGSAKKMADAAVTTSKQAATQVGGKVKSAAQTVGYNVTDRLLNPNDDVLVDSQGNARNRGRVEARRAKEAEEKKALAAQNQAIGRDVSKRLEATDAEYNMAKKRVEELGILNEQQGGLDKLQKEEMIAKKKLMQAKRDAIREEIRADKAEAGTLLTARAARGTPEYKEQQRLAKEQRNEPFSKMSGKMSQIGMTAGMAAGALSMIPGPLGQIAGQASGAIAGLGMITSFINGPLSGAIVAAVAVFASMYLAIDGLNNKFKESVISAQKSKEAIGASTKAIRALSEFNKKVTAGELMDKVRADKLVGINAAAGKTTFGESYVKSEQGTAFMKELKEKVKEAKGVTDGIIADYANQLSTAVASGAIDANQAASIAANVGAALGDTNFAFKVRAQVGEIIGPNGENLKKDPITISAIIQGRSVEQLESSKMNLQKATAQNRLWSGGTNNEFNRSVTAGGTALGIAGAGAAAGFGTGAAIGAIAGGGVFSAPAAAIGAIAGTLIGAVAGYSTAMATLQEQAAQAGEMAGAMIGDMNIALQQQKEMADILDRYYMKKLEEAKAEGNITEQKRLQLEYDEKKNKLAEINEGLTTAIVDTYNSASGDAQEALRSGAQTALDAKYKDSPDQIMFLELIKQGLDKATSSNNITGGDKMLLQTEMISGNILPSDMSKLIALMSDKEMSTKVMNIVTEFGATTATQFAQTMGMIKDDAVKKEVALEVSSAGSAEEALEILDLVQKVEQLGGVISADFIVSYFQKNDEVADKTIGLLQEFDQQGNKLNAKVAMTIDTTLEEGANFDAEYFDKLKTKDKNQYLQVIESIIQVDAPIIQATPDYTKWLNDEGAKLTPPPGGGSSQWWIGQYAMSRAFKVTTETPASALDLGVKPPPTGGGGGPDSSWLDQYVKVARDAGEATQKLTTGFKASSAALIKFAGSKTDLVGLFTQLKKAGASADIIAAALGGDEATTKALIDTKTGQLKKGAATILAGIKKAIFQQKMTDWLGLTNAEKRDKKNEMFGANLEVIKIQEDEINKRYDDRIKALDTINNLNERNAAQQQSTLTLADALSKGDIAAAARAALEKRKQNTQFAIEDQKKGLEFARELELKKISVDVNGVIMTRAELEEKIRINSELNTKAKAEELEYAIRIGAYADTLYNKQKASGGSSTGGGGGETTPAPTGTRSPTTKKPTTTKKPGPTTTKKPGPSGAVAVNPSMSYYGLGEKFAGLSDNNNGTVSGLARQALNLANTQKTKLTASYGSILKNGETWKVGKLNTYLSEIPANQIARRAQFKAAYTVWENMQKKSDAFVGKDEFGNLLTQYSPAAQALYKSEFNNLPDFAKTNLQIVANRIIQKTQDDKDLATIKNKAKALYKKYSMPDSTTMADFINSSEVSAGDRNLMSSIRNSYTSKQAIANANKLNVSNARKYLITQGITKDNSEWYLGESSPFGKKSGWSGGQGYAMGGMVIPKGYADGGGIFGTDTVPAMLTPGEFVVRKAAVDAIGIDKLNSINSGTASSESVYNYSINVNVSSAANADDIARTVMTQIRQTESQRVRSNTY